MRALLERFRPGEKIYLPGATGEILALTRALKREPDRMHGVTVISCLLPGMNEFDYASLDGEARLIIFSLPRALRPSFESGRTKLIATSYRGVAAFIRETATIDTAVAHLAAPDSNGQCSFGVAADFSPIAWRAARCRVAVLNPLMPAMARGPRVPLAEADFVVECESPLVEVAGHEDPTDLVVRIARRGAALIRDGSTIQLGIGRAPAALFGELTAHRDLRIRSGLVAAEAQALAAAGALSEPSRHRVGIAAGTAEFYRYLSDSDLVEFGDADVTHDVATLGAIDRFYAINAALQIDLMGQVNLEWQNWRLVGGVGGAPEFVRAGLLSHGGGSLTLIPSTSRDGKTSRIVTCLSASSVSMARNDIGTVVTENGVAELRNLSLDERASALIAIAGEEYREELGRGWRRLRAMM